MHQRQLDLPHTLPTELRVEVGRPQAAVPDLLLQWRDGVGKALTAHLGLDEVERFDFAQNVFANPGEVQLEGGARGQVPRHTFLLLSDAERRHQIDYLVHCSI